MPQKLYSAYENRRVGFPAGHEEAVHDTIRKLSQRCKLGVVMLLDELAQRDPGPDELCGIFGESFDVYAAEIPSCAGRRLIVAMRQDDPAAGATVLGAVPRAQAGVAAQTLALRYLDARHAIWETTT